MGGLTVSYGKEMYAYEVDPQREFRPDVFIDITDVLPSVIETINFFRKLNAEAPPDPSAGRLEATMSRHTMFLTWGVSSSKPISKALPHSAIQITERWMTTLSTSKWLSRPKPRYAVYHSGGPSGQSRPSGPFSVGSMRCPSSGYVPRFSCSRRSISVLAARAATLVLSAHKSSSA